ERRGTSFGKGLERSAGGDEFRSVVWQREIVLPGWVDIDPVDGRGGVGGLLASAVAATEALDERRPRSQFGDEGFSGNIHACLDGLRRDYDFMRDVAVGEDGGVLGAITSAEAGVDEREFGAGGFGVFRECFFEEREDIP